MSDADWNAKVTRAVDRLADTGRPDLAAALLGAHLAGGDPSPRATPASEPPTPSAAVARLREAAAYHREGARTSKHPKAAELHTLAALALEEAAALRACRQPGAECSCFAAQSALDAALAPARGAGGAP